MENCIFCKIINGDIPSKTIYEDDIVKVFLDINPVKPGHMLIIPKKHVTDFTELDDEIAVQINKVVKLMKEKIYKELNPNGLRIMNNYGVLQEVKHYHLHIIPSYENDCSLTVDEIYDKLK